jgi:putative membrane protein
LSSTELGDALAAVNASLNATSAVALFVGFVMIRRRRLRAHRAAMLTALSASALFLIFYLTRVGLTGTHTFAGEGWARTLYLSVLFSHMVLAVLVLPFVLRLVYLVRHHRFHEHARLARRVFPVWAYVSVTGLLVYLLLYQIFGYT